jgi:FkbM family methyltransferase
MSYEILRRTGTYRIIQRVNELRYLKRRIEFYKTFLAQGQLAFDIGANMGNRTNVFARLGCKVMAVEPQKNVFEYLQRRFRDKPQIICLNEAVGEKAGWADIIISEADGLSTMSREWIDRVKKSGRFTEIQWKGTERVRLTTLDKLISAYGEPSFCKIDVEGYELHVLRGLSQPVKALSFEFNTPESNETTVTAITYLNTLGKYEFNLSFGESMRLEYKSWLSSSEFVSEFRKIKTMTFGDIYARLLR